jgi:hypothetical protein
MNIKKINGNGVVRTVVCKFVPMMALLVIACGMVLISSFQAYAEDITDTKNKNYEQKLRDESTRNNPNLIVPRQGGHLANVPVGLANVPEGADDDEEEQYEEEEEGENLRGEDDPNLEPQIVKFTSVDHVYDGDFVYPWWYYSGDIDDRTLFIDLDNIYGDTHNTKIVIDGSDCHDDCRNRITGIAVVGHKREISVKIEDYAFHQDSSNGDTALLREVFFPKELKVLNIGKYAFAQVGGSAPLKTVSFPVILENLTIGEGAFLKDERNSELLEVVFPSITLPTTAEIGDNAFGTGEAFVDAPVTFYWKGDDDVPLHQTGAILKHTDTLRVPHNMAAVPFYRYN